MWYTQNIVYHKKNWLKAYQNIFVIVLSIMRMRKNICLQTKANMHHYVVESMRFPTILMVNVLLTVLIIYLYLIFIASSL